MSEFNARVKMLEALGVEYRVEHEYRGEPPDRTDYPLEIFRSVKLPLTYAEWASLYMRDGQFYMGGCCGSMSALQDVVCHQIRTDSGWFDIRTLGDIAIRMIEHDGDEGTDDEKELSFSHLPQGVALGDFVRQYAEDIKAATRTDDALLDPWMLMQVVWHITKDFFSPEVPAAYGDHMSDLDKAVSTLGRSLEYLSMERVFRWDKEKTSQDKAGRSFLLYRMLPALKVLNENIDGLDLGPLEGWALIEKEKGPEAICRNGYGMCIYDSKEKIDEVLNLWRRDDAEHKDPFPDRKPIDERIGVRRVRVSKEKGIEFLD
jgi:hypothetical protein